MQKNEDPIEAAWQARREGRLEDAEGDLLKAIEDSRRAGASLDVIRGLKALAHVLRDAGQHQRALPLYEEAIALSRERGDALLLAHTVRHLGDLHRDERRFDEAERCYAEALSLYRAAPSPPALDFANALRPAALLKEHRKDTLAARELWTEARALYHAAGIQAAVDECTRHLQGLR